MKALKTISLLLSDLSITRHPLRFYRLPAYFVVIQNRSDMVTTQLLNTDSLSFYRELLICCWPKASVSRHTCGDLRNSLHSRADLACRNNEKAPPKRGLHQSGQTGLRA
jgi:hypothetical protein